MKYYLLALTVFSLNTYSATVPLTWSGVVPSIGQTPANVELQKDKVNFVLYNEHIELSAKNFDKEQIIVMALGIPTLSLDL